MFVSIPTRLLPVFLVCGLVVAGCELSNRGKQTMTLDDELVIALTKNGERTLANFILPDSDDFDTIFQDPRNQLTPEKVELGKLLFHETALATAPAHEEGRGTYSCATCHHAAAGFQAGRQQSIGDGGIGWGTKGEGRRRNPVYAVSELNAPFVRSPSILNSAYQRITMWSGSLGAYGLNRGTEEHWTPGTPYENNSLGYYGVETQAITALTGHRFSNIESSIVVTNPVYQELWERAFPGEPVSLELAGLAIAAYERTVYANQAPFQRWLKGEPDAMSAAEKRGALIFFGDTGCERMCHTGAPLNSVNYYAMGMPDMKKGPGIYGDPPAAKGRGEFLNDPNEYYKFKIPQLYNLKDSEFLAHGGAFKSIREIVEYYNEAKPFEDIPDNIIHFNFKPLNLTDSQIDDLVLFLSESLHDPNLMRYVPESLPSGNCTAANDPLSRIALGCDPAD